MRTGCSLCLGDENEVFLLITKREDGVFLLMSWSGGSGGEKGAFLFTSYL